LLSVSWSLHRDEQRIRSFQWLAALPCFGQPRKPEVPSIRAGVQELANDTADGWWKGRVGLRSEGQERQRGHAVLPKFHDRAGTAHRTRHRCPGRRYRGWRTGDLFSVWPI